MHCNGCEDLLQKDYNICITCHSDDEKLMTDYQMHPFSDIKTAGGKRTDVNHAPRKNRDYKRGCACRQGPYCKRCNFMVCCSCKCHQNYSLRFRFYGLTAMENMIASMDAILRNTSSDIAQSDNGKSSRTNTRHTSDDIHTDNGALNIPAMSPTQTLSPNQAITANARM
eukprot:scaffold4440_cov133-Chaetoceros_neogracile.AAC.1